MSRFPGVLRPRPLMMGVRSGPQTGANGTVLAAMVALLLMLVWSAVPVKAGQTGGGDEELDQAAQLFETGYQYQTGEGRERDLKRALAYYGKALQVYPDVYPEPFAALYNSALIYSELEQYRNAQRTFIRAVRAAQELSAERPGEDAQRLATRSEAMARSGLGTCYQRDGKLREAEQQYRIAIQKYPQLVEAHFNLLNVLGEQKRWDEMEMALARAAAAAPSSRYEIFRGRRAGQEGQSGLGAYGGVLGIGVIGAALAAYFVLLRVRRPRR
jgi:tetratricopeptide (TPR) repeat protein